MAGRSGYSTGTGCSTTGRADMGRKRSAGERYASGRLNKAAARRAEKLAHGLRLQYRYRDGLQLGLSFQQAAQAEWTVLGLLREIGEDRGGISSRQYYAGHHYCWVCHKHARVMGYALGRPTQLSMDGRSLDRDPTDEEIAQVRDDWRICYEALEEAREAMPQLGRLITQSTYNACVLDRPPQSIPAMRIGLNMIGRALDRRGRRG
jgi:hypothetical protein